MNAGAEALARRFLSGPIAATILKLAAPNVLGLVAATITIAYDGHVLGRLGADALAGVSLVFPWSMLMFQMSGGGMGSAIASAVARALGARRAEEAAALVWHALAIALGMSALFALTAALVGERLYRAMGGEGAALAHALAYSAVIFGGATATWTTNVLGGVLRGSGNMVVPAFAMVGSALGHLLLCPLLVFGLGPVPALGTAGAAASLVILYSISSLAQFGYLCSTRSSLKPSLRGVRLRRAYFRSILRVGLPASLSPVLSNLSVAVVTGYAASFGTAVLAGYGMGARLEYVLVPLTFGIGAALVTLVGVNIGAGQPARAKRIAWTGGAMAAAIAGAIGGFVALLPHTWIGLFTRDAAVLAAGMAYLRIVGPFYAFFGLGLSLFFASQGAGRMFWPLVGSFGRLFTVACGGWLAARAFGGGMEGLCVVIAAAFTLYGAIIALSLTRVSWGGELTGAGAKR